LERYLYRLGFSPHKEKFILKGAMLFPLWGGELHRPIRDLDLHGSGEAGIAHLPALPENVRCRIACFVARLSDVGRTCLFLI
jgi:hypothetical protein